MATTKQSLSTSLKMGIIVGLVYCIFIFIQNQFFYSNPIQFIIAKSVCYILIIAGFFYTGYLVKRESGGYITFQECLKAMLLAIAIAELIYLLFGLLYTKIIDPTFIDKMKIAFQAFYVKMKMPADQINEQMKKFNDAGKSNWWILTQSYGFSIIIDAVFAVIFAAILKKQKPSFENQF